MIYKLPTGFTLIEALVAVTILTLAVAGPLVTANRAVVSAQTSRDQLTASYLAQEGIEYVHMVRDNAFLATYPPGNSSTAWTNFLSSVSQCDATTNSTRACTFDPVNGFSTSCTLDSSCGPLYLTNATPQRFVRTSLPEYTQTIFTRTVQVFQDNPTSDARVTSQVSWTYHGTTYSVRLTEHLTPWQ